MRRNMRLGCSIALACVSPARAETIILDGGTGAAYDSVGDGWFFARRRVCRLPEAAPDETACVSDHSGICVHERMGSCLHR
jgi:hypothetical protein